MHQMVSVRPPSPSPLSHPARPEAWLAGWASGLAGWPRGEDGKFPHSTGLRPLLGPLPKKRYLRKERK